MNNIQGINGYGGPPVVGPQSQGRGGVNQPTAMPKGSSDKVEISPVAQFLSKIAEMPDIRPEKVESIRQALAEGSYDIDGKVPAALDRLFEEYSL